MYQWSGPRANARAARTPVTWSASYTDGRSGHCMVRAASYGWADNEGTCAVAQDREGPWLIECRPVDHLVPEELPTSGGHHSGGAWLVAQDIPAGFGPAHTARGCTSREDAGHAAATPQLKFRLPAAYLKAERSVLSKQRNEATVEPPRMAGRLQGLRQIPVVQRDKWLDAMSTQLR